MFDFGIINTMDDDCGGYTVPSQLGDLEERHKLAQLCLGRAQTASYFLCILLAILCVLKQIFKFFLLKHCKASAELSILMVPIISPESIWRRIQMWQQNQQRQLPNSVP